MAPQFSSPGPPSHLPAPDQLLGQFLAQIQSLQQAVAAGPTPGSTLQGQFLALQQLAQQGVLQLTPEAALPPAAASVAGDSVAGESVAGESVAGESVAGESVAGESVAEESVAEEPVAGDSIVAYQTEISRTLRLLGMDVTFLQAARQPHTRLQRQRQLGDRLIRLQRHSEGLLTALRGTP